MASKFVWMTKDPLKSPSPARFGGRASASPTLHLPPSCASAGLDQAEHGAIIKTMSPSDNHTADTDPEHHRLQTREQARDAIAGVFQLAQRQLLLFAPFLEAHYFNTARVEALIGEFIGRQRDNQLRVLVEDARQALLDNARLTKLAHRLPDCVHIRQVGESHRGLRELFVVADHSGYFHQPQIERADSVTSTHATRTAVQLARRFEQMWEQSEPVEYLSRLGL